MLDSAHETLLPQSWVAIIRPVKSVAPDASEGRGLLVYRADAVDVLSRADYGVTGKVTRVRLDGTPATHIHTPGGLEVLNYRTWLEQEFPPTVTPGTSDAAPGILSPPPQLPKSPPRIQVLRETVVYAQSERLEVAELPITKPVMESTIELNDLYDGLDPGRWIIVEGERADLRQNPKELVAKNAEAETGQALGIRPSGVRTAELVRVAAVDPIRGTHDTPHSHLTVTPALTHAYKRDTVIIHGNVVLATHGEIRREVLGSGDASKPYQTFALAARSDHVRAGGDAVRSGQHAGAARQRHPVARGRRV